MSAFLFVHLSKTAGTSLTAILSSLFKPEELAPFLGGAKPLFEQRKPEYRLYAGHYEVYDATRHFPDLVWLTMLRDPVARAISQYRSWHNPRNLTPYWEERIDPEELEALRLAHRLSLEEYVFSDNRFLRGSISNYQVRMLGNHTLPKTNFVTAPAREIPREIGREILESATRNLRERFAFTGLSERFAESLELFDANFGLGVAERGREVVMNVSDENEEASNPSPRVIERIKDLNSLDIPLYEIACEEFEKRLAGDARARRAG